MRLEERILQREESLEARLAEVSDRERTLGRREREVEQLAGELEQASQRRLDELERLAGIGRAQARQLLLQEVEEQARHEKARVVRQVEEEARREATRRSRNILSACMQRLAASHAAETTVSLVALPSDDMKGRIIGREGRNIRALENITGVDLIIDETPSAVVLSCFDPVRREIARLTLEKLIADGRIHPARIEEAYYQAKTEIDNHVMEQGEQALFEANVHAMHPELVKLLGRLKFRTSYGQNVLAHSIEVSRLAAMIADELGASAKTARRAALLHDLGKAVTHELEGPHALVGRRAGPPLRRVRGRRARDGGAPQRGRDADRRGRDRADGRRAVGRAARRARRVARPVREAAQEPRGDRQPPRGRRQGVRGAGRARGAGDGLARARSTTTAPRCCHTRSPARSSGRSSTRARSR